MKCVYTNVTENAYSQEDQSNIQESHILNFIQEESAQSQVW